jgi:hypothetical protein
MCLGCRDTIGSGKLHPASVRERNIRTTFGLGWEAYSVLFDSQRGKCAICKDPILKLGSGDKRACCVDHDHETGAVRGLLCTSCNVAIGMLKEDTDVVRYAMAYLAEHK